MNLSGNKNIALNFFLALVSVFYLIKIESDFISYISYNDVPVQDETELLTEDYSQMKFHQTFEPEFTIDQSCKLKTKLAEINKILLSVYQNKIEVGLKIKNPDFNPSQTFFQSKQSQKKDSDDEDPRVFS